jgi:non-ribosomal peptide synthetase component F
VIYTSGSTGRPKGVEMTHRGASNLLHWYLGATRITERDSVLVVTSFSFHLTQRNLLAPLFVGGRVHLAREPFEPGRITAQIVASGITMMNLTPTGFQALVEADGGKAIGGLRIVVFGGEPLYPRQLARVPEPRPEFLNPYGPRRRPGSRPTTSPGRTCRATQAAPCRRAARSPTPRSTCWTQPESRCRWG